MRFVFRGLANLSITIMASLVLILLSVIYFMLTIWVIKIGATWAGFNLVDGNWVVLTAGLVTASIVIGSAIQQ